MLLATFNDLPAEQCAAALLDCCACRPWAAAVAGGRPYASTAALTGRAAAELASLADADVLAVAAGHPRIGDRPAGADRHAAWSRREQAGVASDDAALATALAEGNRRYEQRFGHVFLICAAGLGGTEILSALHRRLGHDARTELDVLRTELAGITRRRLEGLIR